MKESLVNKYIESQKNYIADVKSELKKRKKETHWIWFIFPQLEGLGESVLSKYYALKSVEEAQIYYKNAYLRRNMNCLIDIILKYKTKDLVSVFGEIDCKKFHSCMTLFYVATKNRRFEKVLNKFYNGCLDKQTMLLLREERL